MKKKYPGDTPVQAPPEIARPEPSCVDFFPGVKRFLARLQNAYLVRLDHDERRFYQEKLNRYRFTGEQWEELLDQIIAGPEKRYTFPELARILEFADALQKRLTAPTPQREGNLFLAPMREGEYIEQNGHRVWKWNK